MSIATPDVRREGAEGGRVGRSEGGREGGWEGGREGGREGGKEGGRGGREGEAGGKEGGKVSEGQEEMKGRGRERGKEGRRGNSCAMQQGSEAERGDYSLFQLSWTQLQSRNRCKHGRYALCIFRLKACLYRCMEKPCLWFFKCKVILYYIHVHVQLDAEQREKFKCNHIHTIKLLV